MVLLDKLLTKLKERGRCAALGSNVCCQQGRQLVPFLRLQLLPGCVSKGQQPRAGCSGHTTRMLGIRCPPLTHHTCA